MTGYAENALNRQDILDEGMDMIMKPFEISVFLIKVREAIQRAGAK